MPSGNICTANIGTAWPLSYGYFRATGMQLIDFTIVPTVAVPSGTFPANMQIGMWDLGEGELDGCDALWIADELQFAFDPSGNLMGSSLLGVTPADPTTTAALNFFTFHSGCDAAVVGGPSSTQEIDGLWSYLGGLATALCYSRRAYYAIGWTPATDDSETLTPVGDFRGMRCRIFDGSGNQVGYGFTTNPIWHAVDLWLRRAIKPEYAIPSGAWPDVLTAQESALFNWPSIYAAAQYCDELLANGQPRFMGSYVFASGSTLAAMLEQVMLCCRGYWYEYAGQIYMFCDQPRDSTFLLTAQHLAGGSLEFDDSQVAQNANRYLASFLETGLPAVATISTINRTSTNVQIETAEANPAAPADLISVGGVADPSFDAAYLVTTTPSDEEIDCTISGGVAASSAGGSLGYIQSRFSQRTPEISHMQHQIALGQILPPNVTGTRLKRIKVSYSLGNMTYDQAMRLLQYEIYRDLGIDWLNPNLLLMVYGNTDLLGSPYTPPWQITLNSYAESVDSSMRALKAQMAGDVITLDPSVFYELAGDYEIMERDFNCFQQEVEDSTSGSFILPPTRAGAMNNGTDSNSGILTLVLRTFNRSAAIFTDVSVAASASFATVPGQLPYAGSGGDDGGGSGFTIMSGTVTVSTPYQGPDPEVIDSSVSWTAIVVRYAGGTTVTYSAASSSANGGGYLYISGGSVVYSATPLSGSGIYELCSFGAPPAPDYVGAPPNTFTITL